MIYNRILIATHIPLLVRTFELSKGDVLELGTGLYSTTILRWLCEMSGRVLYSYERDRKWYEKVSKKPVPYHKVIYTTEWAKADIDRHWGMAFIDHDQGRTRRLDIRRLAHFAEYIVIHDTNPEWDREYRFTKIWPLFKYRYDFKKYPAWTSVVSNFHDLKELED